MIQSDRSRLGNPVRIAHAYRLKVEKAPAMAYLFLVRPHGVIDDEPEQATDGCRSRVRKRDHIRVEARARRARCDSHSCSARMTGTYLFRSFGFKLLGVKPVHMML